MGPTIGCCGHQVQIVQFDNLHLIDPSLVQQIRELRKKNQTEIERSQQVKYTSTTIFRGTINSNGKRQKYGQFYCEEHAFFGYFQNDLPHGFGIVVKNENEYYRGFFSDGKYQGNGKQYSSFHCFQGEFDMGSRKKGNLKTSELQYQGQFRNNVFHGQGRLYFSNGNTYEGQFKNGQFQGIGLLTFENGNVYEGQFHEGKYHGKGAFTWPDGTSARGTYQNGVSIKKQMFKSKKSRKLLQHLLKDQEREFNLSNSDKKQTQKMNIDQVDQGRKPQTGNGMLYLLF